MIQKLDWEHQIGRRIRLRDLHILLTVSQRGSMAQAAVELGVSQPAVSGAIADLERTLGVPLFDRSARGVQPTVYARAMIDRSVAAFDELRQGIRTLENLADPTAGELWIGCVESIAASTLPSILQEFMQQFPRVAVHVRRLISPKLDFHDLSERNLDLVLARNVKQSAGDSDGMQIETLLDDRLVVAVGAHSHLARRRDINLSDLVDEPWVLTPPDCWTHAALMEAFRTQGLRPPRICLTAYSLPLRMNLIAGGPYITVFPESIKEAHASRLAMRILPIPLPASAALAIVTLKNRILNPVAERFIEHVRNYAAARSVVHSD